jgi:hypothetical protein
MNYRQNIPQLPNVELLPEIQDIIYQYSPGTWYQLLEEKKDKIKSQEQFEFIASELIDLDKERMVIDLLLECPEFSRKSMETQEHSHYFESNQTKMKIHEFKQMLFRDMGFKEVRVLYGNPLAKVYSVTDFITILKSGEYGDELKTQLINRNYRVRSISEIAKALYSYVHRVDVNTL